MVIVSNQAGLKGDKQRAIWKRKLKFIADLPLHCPIYAEPSLIPLVGDTPDILALAASMPPYLVRPINAYECYGEHKEKQQPHFVKIFDFGHGVCPLIRFRATCRADLETIQNSASRRDFIYNTR